MYTRKKNNYILLILFWFFVSSSSICHLSSLDDTISLWWWKRARKSNSFDVLYAVYINYMTNLRWIPIYVCFYAAVVSLYICFVSDWIIALLLSVVFFFKICIFQVTFNSTHTVRWHCCCISQIVIVISHRRKRKRAFETTVMFCFVLFCSICLYNNKLKFNNKWTLNSNIYIFGLKSINIDSIKLN